MPFEGKKALEKNTPLNWDDKNMISWICKYRRAWKYKWYMITWICKV